MAPLTSTFLLLAYWTLATRTFAQGSQNFTDEQIAREIDSYVHQLMNCHLSPALTLTVVKDGKVVLAKGYGYTSTNRTREVTSKTKFAIASLTKAFTATLVAKWVREQDGITIDTPIQTFYPDFQVTDEYRSSKATLRDLLSHRMGVPSNFKALIMGFSSDISRDVLTKRLAFMSSDLSFREVFVYNNYMFTAAAYVMEKMSGNRKWEELLRNAILIPLNMTNSGYVHELQDFADFALSCALVNETVLVDLPTSLFKTVSQCAPAGALYSNAEDMAKWMKFLLSEGLGPGGVALVDPEVIRMTFEPGILSGLSFDELVLPHYPVSHVVQSYDLGWITSNYRGYRKIYHTGGIVTHSSRLWLFPDVNAGIYVNVNGPQEKDNKNSLLEPLMYYASDLILKEKPWIRKEDACLALAPATSPASASTSSQDNLSTQTFTFSKSCSSPEGCSTQSTNQSSHEEVPGLSDFVGNYSHKCFGLIEISLHSSGQSLLFRFGLFGCMNLRRVSTLEFVGRYFGPLCFMNPPGDDGDSVIFSKDSDGYTDGLLYSLDSRSRMTRFTRVGFGSMYDCNFGQSINISASFPVMIIATLTIILFYLLRR